MAKYLRPRRGSTNNAKSVVLVKGEMFMEYPNGRIGMEPGRIIVGNGTNACSSINYATTSTNVFQPFITDPSIYTPRFANTTTASGSGSVTSIMSEISNIDGSASSTKTLPNIIGSIRKSLIYHDNSITKLNSDKVNLNTTVTFNNSFPSTYTANFPNGGTRIQDSFLELGYSEYYSNISGGTTYTNNIYLSPQGPYININRNDHSASIDSNDYCELAPYNIGIGEKDSNLNDRNYIKMIDNNYDLRRQFISGSSTYGWGNYTGTSFNGNSLNTFLNGTGVKFMSIAGTIPSNATAYYSYYYRDISASSIGLSGKFIIGMWLYLSTNIPAFLQIADGSIIRIYSQHADCRGKTFTIRVAYTDYELANTTKYV